MDSFDPDGRRAAAGSERNQYWICNIQLNDAPFLAGHSTTNLHNKRIVYLVYSISKTNIDFLYYRICAKYIWIYLHYFIYNFLHY